MTKRKTKQPSVWELLYKWMQQDVNNIIHIAYFPGERFRGVSPIYCADANGHYDEADNLEGVVALVLDAAKRPKARRK